ncbi:MAG TPA: hypothetical protein VJQ44_06510 [Gemmatimonadales bacterium]|nr:hypothetical protein [Gemmatimonadales bacterium]
MSARLSAGLLPRLTAAAFLSTIPACSGDGIVVPGDGAIARLEAVAGDGQRAFANHPVAEPLVVRAVDGAGRPVTGAEISFRFINADGRVPDGSVATGVDGQATAVVTLGGSVGTQVVEARLVDPQGLAVEFQLTALQQETPAPGDGGNGGNDGNGDGGNGSGGNGNNGNGNNGNGNSGSGNGGNGHGDDGGSVGSGGGGSGGGAGDVGGGGGGGSGGDDGNGGNGGSGGGGGSGGSGGGSGGGGGDDGNGGNGGHGNGHHEHGDGGNHHGHGHHGGGEHD